MYEIKHGHQYVSGKNKWGILEWRAREDAMENSLISSTLEVKIVSLT